MHENYIRKSNKKQLNLGIFPKGGQGQREQLNIPNLSWGFQKNVPNFFQIKKLSTKVVPYSSEDQGGQQRMGQFPKISQFYLLKPSLRTYMMHYNKQNTTITTKQQTNKNTANWTSVSTTLNAQLRKAQPKKTQPVKHTNMKRNPGENNPAKHNCGRYNFNLNN